MNLLDQDIWDNILNSLEENISEKSFNTFFKSTKLFELSDNKLSIEVETDFASSFLNKNYAKMLEDIALQIYDKKYEIKFYGKNRKLVNHQKVKDSNISNSKNIKLNERFTFDQFVVGKNNNFAYSAAYGVAESPGVKYNPLFIYGNSGMGKTHLMQAIGHYVQNCSIKKKVVYTTSENFTNELISSIKNKSGESFRNSYRNVDILLIDDIQFFNKKESSQEEFFSTFNILYDSNKQIVITSDKPPKDLDGIEKRLVSRFEGGLTVDLSIPEYETRVAIVENKISRDGTRLSKSVIDFICENIVDNIRTLEGAITKLLAYSSFNDIDTEEIEVSLAKDILSTLISKKVESLTLDNIKEKVCEKYGITTKDILSKTKKKNIVFPRQIGMYLSNFLIPQLALKHIAQYYKRKDHSTVINARRLIQKKMEEDKSFYLEIQRLIENIKY